MSGDMAPGDNESTSDLIQRIKLGTLDPAILEKEQRQACIEALFFESLPQAGIAQFLKVSDRTVRRDLEEIRGRNALSPDPDLAREIIGEFVLMTRVHVGNLMKLARSGSASTGERTNAEYLAHVVGSDMIAKLQGLGYLPKSADALLVMHKKEERESDERVKAFCEGLDDLAPLLEPKQAEKILEIKAEVMKKKDPNGEK